MAASGSCRKWRRQHVGSYQACQGMGWGIVYNRLLALPNHAACAAAVVVAGPAWERPSVRLQ
jgi:hypothetical protein